MERKKKFYRKSNLNKFGTLSIRILGKNGNLLMMKMYSIERFTLFYTKSEWRVFVVAPNTNWIENAINSCNLFQSNYRYNIWWKAFPFQILLKIVTIIVMKFQPWIVFIDRYKIHVQCLNQIDKMFKPQNVQMWSKEEREKRVKMFHYFHF